MSVKRTAIAQAIPLLLLVAATAVIPVVQAFEINATDSVTRVIDGDTFDTAATGRIRLADIDAPESYESGYAEATDALNLLVVGKTVLLDIDNLTGKDQYGREVCVVYVRYNATHILNVNEVLVLQGNAVVTDFSNNEFNPGTWTTYVYYTDGAPSDGGNTSIIPVIAILVVIVVAVFLGSRYLPRSRRLRIRIG